MMQKFRLILPDEFLAESPPEEIPDVKTYLHQRIKIALQMGRIPWRIPVSHDPNAGLPHNVRTGRRYRGVNTLLLCDTNHTKGYHSRWWGTAEDWESVGFFIEQGKEPTVIAQYRRDWSNQIDHSLVYNAAQVHGAEEYQALLVDAIVTNDESDFGLMGMLLEHHAPDIRYDVGDENYSADWNGYIAPEPWYNHPDHRFGDYILMQSAGKFPSKADHFSVMLHEMMHWAEVRTGWMHCLPVREFVAEAGMHVLGLELGVPHCFDNHNHFKWLRYWNPIFHKDENFFLWAMAQVDRACDFLLEPILGRRQDFYHDPWRFMPPVHHLSGPDHMSFDVAW